MEGIPLWGQWVGFGSGWGLVGMFCWLIYTGKLLPATSVALTIASYERQLEDAHHDRDEWRASHRISEVARVESSAQVDKLIEHSQVTEQFLRALPLSPPSDRTT